MVSLLLLVLVILLMLVIIHYAVKRRQLDDEIIELQHFDRDDAADPLFINANDVNAENQDEGEVLETLLSSPKAEEQLPKSNNINHVAIPRQLTTTSAEQLIFYLQNKALRSPSAYQFLQAMLNCGFHLGNDQRFYRHRDLQGRGRILFVASMMPQGFNPSDLVDYQLKEIKFSLDMAHSHELVTEFNLLYKCAQQIAKDLNMLLLTDNHQVVDDAARQHYKQRILAFQQQQLDHNLLS